MLDFLKVVLRGRSKYAGIGFNIHTFYLGDWFVKRHKGLPDSNYATGDTCAPTLRNKEKTGYGTHVM